MISVCIATRNGERYVHAQLASILRQLGPEDEVLISDDSSTDGTVDIIRGLADQRIRLLENNTFYSPIFNFENALKRAVGDIIVLSDQDDVWLEGRVELIREKFRETPHRWYLMVTDGRVVDADERVVSDSIFGIINAGPGFLKNLWNNRYMGCCMAFSRELLEIALPFPRNLPMHDMWLGQLCELAGVTEFVPVPTILYRRHGASQTEFTIRLHPWLQIRRRWILLCGLLRRIRQARAVSRQHAARNREGKRP